MLQEAQYPGLKPVRPGRQKRRKLPTTRQNEWQSSNCGLAAKSVAEKENFLNISLNDTGIFKLAKQMDKTNQMLLTKNVLGMMLVNYLSMMGRK